MRNFSTEDDVNFIEPLDVMESLDEYSEGGREEDDEFAALAEAQAAAFSDESLYELTGTEVSSAFGVLPSVRLTPSQLHEGNANPPLLDPPSWSSASGIHTETGPQTVEPGSPRGHET